MERLETQIHKIGQELVACTIKCQGLNCDHSEGVLPRCLILESNDRKGLGCAAVGINPGQSLPDERILYRNKGPNYSAVLEYWNEKIRERSYYKRLRHFLNQAGITGPILWTDLAKCEKQPGRSGLPPLSSLRTCTGMFLTREIELLPPNWPIVAIGREAFKALAYMYPTRTIIGVPHPTGSYGNFSRIMPDGDILPIIKKRIAEIVHSPGNLLWVEPD